MSEPPNDYVPTEPLIQLDIGDRVSSGCKPIDAIRGWWVLNGSKASAYDLVLGKSGREIVGAYRPKTGSWTRRKDRRWGVDPIPAEDVWDDYVGKAVPDEYYGSQNPVRYVAPHPDL